jgi:hypothetical protein
MDPWFHLLLIFVFQSLQLVWDPLSPALILNKTMKNDLAASEAAIKN